MGAREDAAKTLAIKRAWDNREIATRAATPEYREGWEKIFSKPKKSKKAKSS